MEKINKWVSEIIRVSSKYEKDNNLKFLAYAKKLRLLSFAFSVCLIFGFGLGATRASDITVERIVELNNNSRQEKNKEPLALNSKLTRAANKKADDMILKNYFSHTA